MAKSIMIQGTMSNVGKSITAAGLCRIFWQDGKRVAPFKAQNMALNSFVTREGLEMGRAQVVQAEAAGVEPSVLMNPILLKPTSDMGSQVIVNGEVYAQLNARDYFAIKKQLLPEVIKAYNTLSAQNDVIVIEGAGSPAEINLKNDDVFVNMGMAKLAKSPVLLVGDIDRGGVFAQIYGTVALLDDDERRFVKGIIINKFRGDKSILMPGIKQLEDLTGIPVLGVVPYMHLDIDDEDSLSERLDSKGTGLIDIAVIRLPKISNFTDFRIFESMDGVSVRYVKDKNSFGTPDMVIIPGTKNTIADLLWLRQSGLEGMILRFAGRGGAVFGICGGYQMLGRSISDPTGAEYKGTVRGMELLQAETVFSGQKTRTRTEGVFGEVGGIFSSLSGKKFSGYEIHMGETECQCPMTMIKDTVTGITRADGCSAGNVYGSYVHGIFDDEDVANTIISALAEKKGVDMSVRVSYEDYKRQQYNLLADTMRESLDMDAVYKILEEGV